MQPLYDYFEDTYIGRRQRRGRRTPLFPIELWNVRERTENDRARTNNKLEGWHRAIQGMFDTAHPTVWRFLEGIKKEEAIQRSNLNAYISGQQFPVKRNSKEINERLKTLIIKHTNNDISTKDFLRGISYNISY